MFDQIAGSPQAARELIQRLSQRLREADDRIVKDERRSGRPHETPTDADSPTALVPANNPYLAAKDPWLQRQFDAKLALTDLPFVVGRGPVAREGGPPLHPNLKLDDTVPFRLSRAGDWLPGLVPLHSRALVQIRSRGSIQEPGGACGEARGRGVVA